MVVGGVGTLFFHFSVGIASDGVRDPTLGELTLFRVNEGCFLRCLCSGLISLGKGPANHSFLLLTSVPLPYRIPRNGILIS